MNKKIKYQRIGGVSFPYTREHRFVVVVRNSESRAQAESDVLTCFAKRNPGRSIFNLLKKKP